MAETAIEWADYTFNPWRGCTKVSPGCANCYAEAMSKRNPGVLGVWGDQGTRVVAAEAYWRQPLKWNVESGKSGVRRRVFCASLADVFEDRPELVAPRKRLFDLICGTLYLDWLLLTKRPENALRMMMESGLCAAEDPSRPQPNLWLGTSVENQKAADERIPHLLWVPAAVRFLSVEPLLGPVDLSKWLACNCPADYAKYPGDESHNDWCPRSKSFALGGLQWAIVGGESGPNARPMHPDWARSLRDQCQQAGVAFFFKQWGEHLPISQMAGNLHYPVAQGGSHDQRYHQLPGGVVSARIGKKAAGRALDGREWSEFPGA